jgi:hypothetical protein
MGASPPTLLRKPQRRRHWLSTHWTCSSLPSTGLRVGITLLLLICLLRNFAVMILRYVVRRLWRGRGWRSMHA